MKQSRWKSLVLWSSIIAQLIAILLLTKVIEPYQAEQYNTLAGLVLQLLVTVGIINVPTDKDKL